MSNIQLNPPEPYNFTIHEWPSWCRHFKQYRVTSGLRKWGICHGTNPYVTILPRWGRRVGPGIDNAMEAESKDHGKVMEKFDHVCHNVIIWMSALQSQRPANWWHFWGVYHGTAQPHSKVWVQEPWGRNNSQKMSCRNQGFHSFQATPNWYRSHIWIKQKKKKFTSKRQSTSSSTSSKELNSQVWKHYIPASKAAVGDCKVIWAVA